MTNRKKKKAKESGTCCILNFKTKRVKKFRTLETDKELPYTPFAVHYEKIRIHLRESSTNSAKIHSLARKGEHLRINRIQ